MASTKLKIMELNLQITQLEIENLKLKIKIEEMKELNSRIEEILYGNQDS